METSNRKARAEKIDSAVWGLFFIWLGFVWLTHLGLGIALLGVSALVLLGQLARVASKLEVKGFWVFVGLCLAIAGVWELTGLQTDIVPVLLIVAGATMLLALFKRTPPEAA